MTKNKILAMIIGVLLIIGMATNTSFAQSNSDSNFLNVSVHAHKQADYSIDSQHIVIPVISQAIIQDKMKDNGQIIENNIIGMQPVSHINGLIDSEKVTIPAEKDTEKAAKSAEKDTVKAAKSAEKDTEKVAKSAEKDTAKAPKLPEKNSKKDA